MTVHGWRMCFDDFALEEAQAGDWGGNRKIPWMEKTFSIYPTTLASYFHVFIKGIATTELG